VNSDKKLLNYQKIILKCKKKECLSFFFSFIVFKMINFVNSVKKFINYREIILKYMSNQFNCIHFLNFLSFDGIYLMINRNFCYFFN